jgi:hypothetical protein
MIARFVKIIGVALAFALVSALAVTPAFGSQSIEAFDSAVSTTQAGGHPDITTSFTLGSPGNPEAARNITVETPQGVFGNPRAILLCASVDFALEQCPSASQAGLITLRANYESNPNYLLGTVPIYNLDPGDSTPARFGFVVPLLGIPITIPVAARTATDYGLRFTVSNITQLTPLAEAELTFWGFPADPSHDAQRFPKGSPGKPAGCPEEEGTGCITGPTAAAITVHPLTDSPTICTGQPLLVKLKVETYQDPANPSTASDQFPPVSGCEKLTFKPVLSVNPTSTEADSAAGLDITLSNPQPLGFAATPSELRSSVITLPEGLSINPDAADGQTACSDDQANFDSEGPAECPDSAKIGTIGIHSTALEGTLEGSIYIGEPKPGDQYRIFLIASGFGLHAKLIGRLTPDPLTGQVTAYFTDLPQVPFDEFDIHLFSSDRGLMATPTACRIYEASGVFYPWNFKIADVTSQPLFSIESGPSGASCPGVKRPFEPRLAAGTTHSISGDYSDFGLQLDRDDGDQFLRDINFTLPPGLIASLRGMAYCPETAIVAAASRAGRSEQNAPSCPAASEIGTTNVAAGPGSHPFHAVGKMYLAGPFKGAPLSVVAVTPALAGPYDYGTVVVRVATHVDPLDAHVVAVSDTVPSIVGGIPIRMRSIRVRIDRSNFMINPTRCAPFAVASQGIGDQGTVTDFSSYFHVDNCTRLGFRPSMTVRHVGSRRTTHRATNPKLQFDLRTRPGDANIRSVSVTLPPAFEIDQRHLGNICSEKELAAKQCAGRTPIGEATTTTPLLDRPLSGPVYAVSGSGGLPRLAFVLNGQVNLVPRADTKTTNDGRLQTTVPVVPDAPIGHFVLTVFGGKTGYLINTRDICGHAPLIKIDFTAQNGKTLTRKAQVKTACKGGKKRPARRGRHAAH